jgi:hypothetical protein
MSGFLEAVDDVNRFWRIEDGRGCGGFWRVRDRRRVVLILGESFCGFIRSFGW